MGEIRDRLLDLALKRKLWPWLILLGIPFGSFPFTQEYFHLSFRDTLWHWFFWASTGALLIAFGVSYWAWSRRKGRWRGLAGLLLILSGAVLILAGLYRRTPPPLPDDKLVVGIAQFTAVGSGASEEAATLPSRIEQDLLEKQRQGAPLQVRVLSESVSGRDEAEKQQAAVRLGKSREGNAHVILWGEVRKDEGELWVKPRLTNIRPLGRAELQQRTLPEYVSVEPTHLPFKERLSNELADVVLVVHGLAYYKTEQWDKALAIFALAGSKDAFLYKGLCFYGRGIRAASPRQDLQAAVGAYASVLGPEPWELRQVSEEERSAFLNRANAISVLAISFEAEEAGRLLREAVNAYRAALEVYTRAALPEDWAMTQNNLGNALRELGTRLGGEEGNRRLREAVDAHRAALEVYTRAALPQDWATTQNNLGNALDELGTRLGGKQGIQYLRESLSCYDNALSVFDERYYPAWRRQVLANRSKALQSLDSLQGSQRRGT